MSKYEAKWVAFDANESFWNEVLVGRTIAGFQREQDGRISALKLDNGEVVSLDQKGIMSVID